jgi:aspartyl-tRNA(Asn)/glutamyl-tRNA(Gln) amidotransferase subunit A
MTGLDGADAATLRQLVVTRQVSPVELARRALDQAEATQATLNCFAHLMPGQAMDAARAAERAVLSGAELGLLHGVPVSVKDLISVAGVPYASGSRAMADNIGGADAPAVERLRAAGAVIIGKTTTSEFGCKPVGDSPLTGITRNPWDLTKTPGGSSAGAAASVAAGITPVALGTDGGGSIRIPAALTGLVGLKAQSGRVPVWPVSATPTLAHVCPIARTVADAALLLAAIAGHDERDPASVAGPVPALQDACRASVAGLRIAWSPTLGYAQPDPEVAALTAAAAARFEALGCHVEQVDRVFDEDPAPIWVAEFYAGVGTRLRTVLETARDKLDPAVADVLDAALRQDMRAYYASVFARYALRDHLRRFFERYDLLLSPVLPVVSIDAGRNFPERFAETGLVTWVQYTYPFNLTGNPAASVCAGLAQNGMPVGLQIVGRSHQETQVIAAASAFERTWPAGYNHCRANKAVSQPDS